MTKEEIVSSLKEQAQEKYDSASFIRMNEGDVLMEAAKMLRDQQASANLDRRRWEGCNACASKCCELCVYQNFGGDDWPCNVCRDGFTAYKPVNYCPVCGRPLTEEAWAKLEEHIDGYYISIESYDKCVDTLKAKLYDMDKEIEELKAELERKIGGNNGTTDIQ